MEDPDGPAVAAADAPKTPGKDAADDDGDFQDCDEEEEEVVVAMIMIMIGWLVWNLQHDTTLFQVSQI